MADKNLVNGFGERLRAERQRLGLSQEGLATQVGLKLQTIFQYEKGHTYPTLPFVYSLSALGFRLQYLLFGREQSIKPKDFPPDVLNYATNLISKIEQQFVGDDKLSDETKLRMMLIILDQFVDEPEGFVLTDAQAMALLVRG